MRIRYPMAPVDNDCVREDFNLSTLDHQRQQNFKESVGISIHLAEVRRFTLDT